MEGIRTDLLIFLNELASIHRDLKETISLCYHMSEDRLFSEDYNTEVKTEIVVPEYKCKPTEIELAYDAFFIESTDKKSVECIFLHGMYFLPGKEEGSIVFGRDYFVVLCDKETLRKVDVVNVSFQNSVLKEKASETPVCDVSKNKNKLGKRLLNGLFWIFVIAVIIYLIVMYL
ncbi:hypothetical protein HXX01_03375 [Candidatus Nomurabacteria bacterium]|nr:hypothetical protein [Candidatus Nomurabacteria bacterium]